MLLFCVVSFTTLLFSYTFRDPSLYFFKCAVRLSDSLFPRGACACRRCMTEPEGDDPWFAERFNLSIHPLMTRANSLLSDDTYKWWQVRFRGNRGSHKKNREVTGFPHPSICIELLTQRMMRFETACAGLG